MKKILIIMSVIMSPIFSHQVFAMNFKILSHNLAMIKDASLYKKMSKHLDKMNLSPDLIFFQEAVENTPQILKSSFQMDGHFSRRPWDHEAVGILTKFPITYKDELIIQSRADNGFTRTAAMIEVKHPRLGLIRAIAIHFAYRPEQSDIRLKQLDEVTKWINEKQKLRPAHLNIIGGDFNATPDEDLFDLLKDFQNPNSNMITQIPTNKRIDYIFYKAIKKFHFKAQEIFPFPNARLAGKQLSDHKSLMIILQ